MTFTTRSSALVGVLAAGVLTLAACGTEGDEPTPGVTGDAPAAQGADAEALAAVVWNDGEGNPVLDFETPFTVSAPAVRLVNEGDGESIEAGHIVTVSYTVTNGVDGELLYSTYDAGMPEGISVGSGELEPALDQILSESQVGADILFAAPDATLVDEAGNPGAVLMAITVDSVSTVLDRAEGTAVDPVEGLPEVTLDDTGAPTLGATEGEPGDELVSQLLIEGDGPVVQPGATVTAHYTGWLWDGTQFDSSWERGQPFTFSLAGGVIEGWIQGVEGYPVGSQVLLVIPPELGYGDRDQGAIPPNSTLVFVVDILNAV